ncbi:MAG: hypothetical protein AB1486_25300 [Planctomycetota bacterium]
MASLAGRPCDSHLQPEPLCLSVAEEKTIAALFKLQSLHSDGAAVSEIGRSAKIARAAVVRCMRSLEAKYLVQLIPFPRMGERQRWEICLRNPGSLSKRWYGARLLALAEIAEKHQGDFGWRTIPGQAGGEAASVAVEHRGGQTTGECDEQCR